MCVCGHCMHTRHCVEQDDEESARARDLEEKRQDGFGRRAVEVYRVLAASERSDALERCRLDLLASFASGFESD